jgi:hypothetical protein
MIDDKPKRRQEDGSVLPPWAKLALTVTGTTITTIVAMFMWATSMFVSRVEYANHSAQNVIDMSRLAETQLRYAVAEKGTSDNLNALQVDVAEIKSDVSWLRQYLDVSKPPPRKNGAGTHR